MDHAESVIVASGIMLPFLFLLYVAYRGEFNTAIRSPPWLRDYALQERKGWLFGTKVAFWLCFIIVIGWTMERLL